MVEKADIEVVFDINVLRFRTVHHKNFGIIEDTDGTSYEAYEIQFHTPGEHSFNGMKTDMEIQIMHRAISGDFRR